MKNMRLNSSKNKVKLEDQDFDIQISENPESIKIPVFNPHLMYDNQKRSKKGGRSMNQNTLQNNFFQTQSTNEAHPLTSKPLYSPLKMRFGENQLTGYVDNPLRKAVNFKNQKIKSKNQNSSFAHNDSIRSSKVSHPLRNP